MRMYTPDGTKVYCEKEQMEILLEGGYTHKPVVSPDFKEIAIDETEIDPDDFAVVKGNAPAKIKINKPFKQK